MHANHLRRRLEILWWLFTLILVIIVMLPIYLNTHNFPFYLPNILYIVIFVTFARYTFLLRYTLIAKTFWPKFLILAGSAILTFVLIMSLGDFSNYLEEKGLQTLVDHHPVKKQYSVMRYIQKEMIFFGVASALSAVVLPMRMLLSIFRMYNHGTE
jgi:hypothetical protein